MKPVRRFAARRFAIWLGGLSVKPALHFFRVTNSVKHRKKQ